MFREETLTVQRPASRAIVEDTLAGLIVQRAVSDPDFTYAIFPNETATFGELYARSMDFARGLHAAGLRSGDHVAILMPNCLDYMVAHFGVQLAGGVSVLLNARFKSHELAVLVGHCDARILVTTSKFDDAVSFSETLLTTFPELNAQRPTERLSVGGAPLLERIVTFGDRPWLPAQSVAALLEQGQSVKDAALANARA